MQPNRQISLPASKALHYGNKLQSSAGKQPPNTSANLPRALITGEPECAEMCFRKLMFSLTFERFQQNGRVGLFMHIYMKFAKAIVGVEIHMGNEAAQNDLCFIVLPLNWSWFNFCFII